MDMVFDATMISQLIGSLGFPIVCAIALFWKLDKSEQRNTETINNLQQAIHNNTIALTELSTLIKKDEE